MELTNAMYKYMDAGDVNAAFIQDTAKQLVLLIGRFATHFAEELWERMGE